MQLYIILGIIILFLIITIYDNNHLTIVHYKVSSKKIPKEFHDLRIALLTDLHNNSYGEKNKELIDKIENQKPDIIVIAGDMLVGNLGHDTKIPLHLISELSGKYPIYYANGNHEQRLGIYEETKDSLYLDYVNQLKKMGVQLLINESITIDRGESSIVITGLEIHQDFYKKKKRPKMSREYLDKTLGKADKSHYNLLIAHNPVYFKDYEKWGADLVVSGHVHGGIIRLPLLGGVISPQYHFFPKYDGGEYKENDSTMILSRGLGSHTIKLRFHNRPELVMITLKGKND